MVKAGFSAHPSHPGLMELYGESEVNIYQSIQDNGNVQYFGNTFVMGNSTRPGGLADSILDPVFFDALDIDSFRSIPDLPSFRSTFGNSTFPASMVFTIVVTSTFHRYLSVWSQLMPKC